MNIKMKKMFLSILTIIMICSMSINIVFAESVIDRQIHKKGPKYEYKTEYGTPQNVSTGYQVFDGQDQNGVSFDTNGIPGYIYCNINAGSSLTLSVSFNAPYGGMSISVPIGRKTSISALGYAVPIPGDGNYYLGLANITYAVTPYITYYREKGSTTWRIFSKGESHRVVGKQFSYMRVY